MISSRPLAKLFLLSVLAVGTLVAQTTETKQPAAPAKKQPAPKIANSTGGTTPHETTSTVVEGNRVTVVYGRPFAKHPRTGEVRKVWGGLVPYGKVWRTGSDEATLLITQQAIVLGGATIPAGAYTLWTLPREDGTAKLIVNKQIGQWGAGPDLKKIYDEANDLARVDLKKAALAANVDQFTIAVERVAAGGGALKLKWEATEYSVPFTLKK
ncbi:MAG: hypothetical protein B9S34_09170 [Opitutia bacterium Tous-C1TDCM]|nr:MAG: hypothetical protein B9S34_09170 [Opitutae bacterium Tous-C1TDCM]